MSAPARADVGAVDSATALAALLGSGTTAANLVVDGATVATFGHPTGPPDVVRQQGCAVVSAWGAPSPATIDAVALLMTQAIDHAIDQAGLVAALVECQNQALSLYEVSRIQSGSLDRTDVEARLLSTVGAVTRSDAVALVTENDIHTWGQPAERSTLERLVGRIDWQSGTTEYHLTDQDHAVLVWQLTDSESTAALAVLRGSDDPYLTSDIKLMTFLSDVVASARRAVTLHEEALAQARLGREHDAASRLAMALLPNQLPVLDGCDVFHLCEPANSAGGDFVTHAVVNDSTLYFAVGDVAGKGLPAALVMAKVVSACRSAFGHGHPSAEQVLTALHSEIHEYLADVGLFVTVLVGVYSPETGVLDLANAGHSPVVAVCGGEIVEIRAGAPPVGVLDTITVRSARLHLNRGDLLIVGSDGLTEQTDPAGGQFGQDLFLSLVASLGERSAEESAKTLLRAVRDFAAGENSADDQTLLVIRAMDLADNPPDAVLELSATTEDVRRLGPWLAALCRPEALANVELATHEVCINVVEHAYANSSGKITLAAWSTRESLKIEIRDHGRPCRPDLVSPPQLGEPQVRGYGLFIARRLMTRVGYQRVGEENIWTLENDWETTE